LTTIADASARHTGPSPDAATESPKMPAKSEIQCSHCRERVFLSAEIAPLGSEPGHSLYECWGCGHVTVQDVERTVENKEDE
jgi:DNA-directed RNA polymerase subunit RPC12/RpoP